MTLFAARLFGPVLFEVADVGVEALRLRVVAGVVRVDREPGVFGFLAPVALGVPSFAPVAETG